MVLLGLAIWANLGPFTVFFLKVLLYQYIFPEHSLLRVFFLHILTRHFRNYFSFLFVKLNSLILPARQSGQTAVPVIRFSIDFLFSAPEQSPRS